MCAQGPCCSLAHTSLDWSLRAACAGRQRRRHLLPHLQPSQQQQQQVRLRLALPANADVQR